MPPTLNRIFELFQSIISRNSSLSVIQKTNSIIVKKDNNPFTAICLLSPKIPPDHPDHVERAAQKAREENCNFFITYNLRDTVLWRTPKNGDSVSREYRVKTYFTIQRIPVVDQPILNPAIEALLKERFQEIIADLNTLADMGHLYAVDIDATFFVHRLHQAVEKIAPLLKKSLATQMYLKPQFKADISAWAVKQGIANYEQEEFLDALSRQIVYRLLGRIIFYQSLRRFLKELPEPDFSTLDPSLVLKKLAQCFENARQIDYQAVFEEEVIDHVSYPETALIELQDLLDDLHRYNFAHMPQDVIGKVFERLIPAEERHALGQYFTREDLVDFINGFCIQHKNDFVLDPTCGTGTFLIRGYDRLKYLGERTHQHLLQQLWGIDIARFPSQLATINLYRQQIDDCDNFPRILSYDFFEVTKDTVFRFPPPRKENEDSPYIEERLPQFNAIVGNFPYIRQELIEKRVKGYKRALERVLASEWLTAYPHVFELKPQDKKELELSQKNGVDIKPFVEKARLLLSGQADIYAYLFFHCGHFLKEGGRMGIVTSNAWLDVAYGYHLQKYFLKNFKIIAVVESRCEPWFEDAAINTIFTVLERCSPEKQRHNHLVKFVKVKKKLKQLIPWDLKNPLERWQGIEKLVQQIERTGSELYQLQGNEYVCNLQGHKTYENDNFRIRVLKQGELLAELEQESKTVKWGKYLRAPEVYFEILKKCADKLVPLKEVAEVRRGYTTGINEFFYLDEAKIKQWNIEPEFLKPVIKSPKEADAILIDPEKLKFKIFMCNKSKEELRQEKKIGALKYIEWGEKQKTKNGVPWSEVPSVKGRRYWWALGDVTAIICWTKSYDDKFIQRFYPDGLLLDQRVYGINLLKDKNDVHVFSALLNSSFTSLEIEINGRVNLGDGALDTTVEEAKEYLLIPNPNNLTDSKKGKITNEFTNLINRSIKSVFIETKLSDRQLLDSAVLEAMGLDPRTYLPKIYEGLCELVRERLELPKMRKGARKKTGKRSRETLKEDVIKEILPEGVKKFPDDFFDAGMKQQNFKSLLLPQTPLKFSQPFFGETEITSEHGFTYSTKNPSEAKYIRFAHGSGSYEIKIPDKPLLILKVVSAYERYIKNLKNKLFESIYNRTHDQKIAHSMVQAILEEFKVPEVQK